MRYPFTLEDNVNMALNAWSSCSDAAWDAFVAGDDVWESYWDNRCRQWNIIHKTLCSLR